MAVLLSPVPLNEIFIIWEVPELNNPLVISPDEILKSDAFVPIISIEVMNIPVSPPSTSILKSELPSLATVTRLGTES